VACAVVVVTPAGADPAGADPAGDGLLDEPHAASPSTAAPATISAMILRMTRGTHPLGQGFIGMLVAGPPAY